MVPGVQLAARSTHIPPLLGCCGGQGRFHGAAAVRTSNTDGGGGTEPRFSRDAIGTARPWWTHRRARGVLPSLTRRGSSRRQPPPPRYVPTRVRPIHLAARASPVD